MEENIAKLMVRMAKFEFFMIKTDRKLVKTNAGGKVEGFNYSALANLIEEVCPFNNFDLQNCQFSILMNEPPQYLVLQDGQLKWDGDNIEIDSWEKFLTKSYAQLRNNLAHGSKSLQAAQFTHTRSPKYLAAGHGVIDFIAEIIFKEPNWEDSLKYS